MATDHSHPEPKRCAHDLAFCEKCQGPYCKTCGTEWVAKQTAAQNSAWEEMLRSRAAKPALPPIPWEDHRPRWAQPAIPMPIYRDNSEPNRLEVYCQHQQNVGKQSNA